MAHSQEPEPDQSSRRSHRWLGKGLVAGSVLLLLGAGGAWRGWVFVQKNLPIWLSAQLSESLSRPVELGPLERLGPAGVRVGPSTIPPTAKDPDTLSLQAVEVRTNWLRLLRRELPLVIELEQADVYLEQNANREWIGLDLDLPDQEESKDTLISVRLDTLRLSDSRLTLVPFTEAAADPPTVALTDVEGEVRFDPVEIENPATSDLPIQTQQVDLAIRGTSVKGGTVDLTGSVLLSPADATQVSSVPRTAPVGLRSIQRLGQQVISGSAPGWAQDAEVTAPQVTAPPAGQVAPGQAPQINLNLRAQAVRATDIMPLVESFLARPLPVQFPTGLVSGSVDMETGGEASPSFTGTARVTEGTVVTKGLPEPLQELQGDVRFKGRIIGFEGVTARLGEVTAKAGGDLDLDAGYDFSGQINPFTLAQVSELFELALPVAATGTFIADVTMTGPLAKPVIATELTSQDTITIDQVAFAEVGGTATLKAPNLVVESFRAIPEAGGAITGSGLYAFGEPGELSLSLVGDNLPADALGRPYGLPDTVTLGPVFVTAAVAGPVGQLTGTANWRAPAGTYPARGDIRLANNILRLTDTFVQVAGGTVAGNGTVALADRRWDATLRANGVQLNQLGANLDGAINGQAQLAGTLDTFSLAGIQAQGVAQATLAGGTINTQAELNRGQWRANVRGNALQLQAFAPDLRGTGSGDFSFSGRTDNLSLAGIQGQGQLVLSDGLASAVVLAPQLAAVQEPLMADLAWNGQAIQVQQASTAGIVASGVITPRLTGPAAPTIANLDLNLTVDNYSLAALPIPDVVPVRGAASFAGRLTGSLDTLTLAGNATLVELAVGELAFASPLTGPVLYARTGGINVDLQGGGDRIQAATGQGDRDLEFLVRNGDALAQGYTQAANFYAQIENLPLDGLNLPTGGEDGFGTVSGTIDSATVAGNWQEPSLRATFDIVDPGFGYISLQTVEVEPDPDADLPAPAPDQPTTLETRYGRLRGTLSYANNVVSLVGGRLESASGVSRYLLSGTYTLGDAPQVNGELVVDNGQIQDILLTLKIFELSDFRLNLLQPPDWFRPLTEADLAALQTQPVGDRNASLLDQLRRLAEVQQLQDILAAQADNAPLPPLDELRGTFSGQVTAKGALPKDLLVSVDLAGANWFWGDPTNPKGVTYRIDEIVARGTYKDDVIALNPVSFSSAPPNFDPVTDDLATAVLNGEFSFDQNDPVDRTLRLDVASVPIAAIRQPLRLPANVDGLINIGAALTGTLDNPQVRGRLAVSQATINRNAIDQAAATFLYKDARLNLLGNVAIQDEVDPLTLRASLPLKLPGVTQLPQSDDLDIQLRVKDEGFALVNLLTQTITWEAGQGELNLDVTGTWPSNKPFQEALTSLVVGGAASFDGVTISSKSLLEPLTNIQGNIQVVNGAGNGVNSSVYTNGLVLDFQNLQGDFSAGQVVADGSLKVVPSVNDLFPGLVGNANANGDTSTPTTVTPSPFIPADERFRLTLDSIALNFRNPAGNYRGRLDGQVVVGGSLYLLEPMVSGEIRLSNGVLTLPDAQRDDETAAALPPGSASPGPSLYQPLPPVFEDFQVVLANGVRLAIPGLVDVNAEGSLDLVGTLPDVKPDGRITLPSGRINLLTTEFRFSGRDNYAEFSASDETIDPYVVADLTAVVPDSTGVSNTLAVATPFPRNEISDAELDQLGLTRAGVQTVRIQARVDGRVSRITQLQGVELSSTPARSQSEIVALVSGGFINALESTLGSVSGGGDGFQGLIAFAGSALLNNIQGFLGAGLERTELRLFSASPPSAQQNNTLDIGGEIGFNFSPSISVSVQKVFTDITPAVFNVRYRITDNITLRGITSYEEFDENTGAILEFQF
ncbi:MAG: translocation/assembly module TamB domain-containing protein [Nodosilinea sp.]